MTEALNQELCLTTTSGPWWPGANATVCVLAAVHNACSCPGEPVGGVPVLGTRVCPDWLMCSQHWKMISVQTLCTLLYPVTPYLISRKHCCRTNVKKPEACAQSAASAEVRSFRAATVLCCSELQGCSPMQLYGMCSRGTSFRYKE
jgi:hypothetical protein